LATGVRAERWILDELDIVMPGGAASADPAFIVFKAFIAIPYLTYRF
jgi:hypothetical protein